MSSDDVLSQVVHAAKKNFFISYTKADEGWAEWIAWELEDAGYTTIIQKWDFRPAQNFLEMMDDAIRQSERLIAVCSPAYLRSDFVRSEWTAALAANRGKAGKLILARVEDIEDDGLMSPMIYIDLVEKSETDAREALLNGVQPGRSKPAARPAFPPHATSKRPPFPAPSLTQGPAVSTVRQRQSVVQPQRGQTAARIVIVGVLGLGLLATLGWTTLSESHQNTIIDTTTEWLGRPPALRSRPVEPLTDN